MDIAGFARDGWRRKAGLVVAQLAAAAVAFWLLVSGGAEPYRASATVPAVGEGAAIVDRVEAAADRIGEEVDATVADGGTVVELRHTDPDAVQARGVIEAAVRVSQEGVGPTTPVELEETAARARRSARRAQRALRDLQDRLGLDDPLGELQRSTDELGRLQGARDAAVERGDQARVASIEASFAELQERAGELGLAAQRYQVIAGQRDEAVRAADGAAANLEGARAQPASDAAVGSEEARVVVVRTGRSWLRNVGVGAAVAVVLLAGYLLLRAEGPVPQVSAYGRSVAKTTRLSR